ncbi:MAG: hypothetical protein VCG02_19670 [Verrucomicrobiota bacterium]
MDYKAKQNKHRIEAFLFVAIILFLAGAYGAFRYLTNPQVVWAATEYKIPEYRTADAKLVGRLYDLLEQRELDALIRETVGSDYLRMKGASPVGLIFAMTFEETFKKELQITVEKRDQSGKTLQSWDIRLRREDNLTAKVAPFAQSILQQP